MEEPESFSRQDVARMKADWQRDAVVTNVSNEMRGFTKRVEDSLMHLRSEMRDISQQVFQEEMAKFTRRVSDDRDHWLVRFGTIATIVMAVLALFNIYLLFKGSK